MVFGNPTVGTRVVEDFQNPLSRTFEENDIRRERSNQEMENKRAKHFESEMKKFEGFLQKTTADKAEEFKAKIEPLQKKVREFSEVIFSLNFWYSESWRNCSNILFISSILFVDHKNRPRSLSPK